MKISAKRIFFLFILASIITFIAGGYYYDAMLLFQENRLEKFRQQNVKGGEPDIFSSVVPKIWVHRVDTKKRLDELLSDFEGFECDVNYDPQKNIFDVYHPPLKSIGLSFEEYIKEKGSKGKYFWLDFKNLDTGNCSKALELLLHLDSIYKIKKRVVVESFVAGALKPFADAGFFTSYYLPMNNEKDIQTVRQDFFPKLNAVSQDASLMKIMAKEFPAKTKLTWLLPIKTYFNRQPLEELYNDPAIKIILVNIKSRGYR